MLGEIVVSRPGPEEAKQNLCADKGYDYAEIREIAKGSGYEPHIKARGVEAKELKATPGSRARRWVAEASHSWFNRFRKILVRFEKKAKNYLALLHLAAGVIAFRTATPCTKKDGMILG